MSTESLRVRGILAQHPSATWAIESPTTGVVIVDGKIEGLKSCTPLHWRAGDWTKPPLDIEINPVSGAIQAEQFVLQDEHVVHGRVEAARQHVGIPVVDVEDWSNDRYRDVRCDVYAVRAEANELVVRLAASVVVSRSGFQDASCLDGMSWGACATWSSVF